jgi:hypothetical protein
MSPFPVSINFELTGLGLVAVATWGLLFARRQLVAMQENNRKQAESARNQDLQSRATVLLALDQRWESEPLLTSRTLLFHFEKSVLQESSAQWPDRSIADLRRLSAPLFASRLEDMEEQDTAKYLRLFQICGFFETVGYVTKANYITLTDVSELFSVSIYSTAVVFRHYIQDLLDVRGADPMLFRNLRWLIAEIEKRKAISLES